eukprot:452819-Pleurochrysis_carterae.AAC.1
MTGEELNGLLDGVQYTQGKLTKGGTWGGGTEHQAMAIMLKTNIVIWDRRYVGKGRVHLTTVAQATDIIRVDERPTIHLLYDHVAKHYEYFSGVTTQTVETRSKPNKTVWREEKLGATARRLEEERNNEGVGRSDDLMGEEALGRREDRMDEVNEANQRKYLLELHIGTLN